MRFLRLLGSILLFLGTTETEAATRKLKRGERVTFTGVTNSLVRTVDKKTPNLLGLKLLVANKGRSTNYNLLFCIKECAPFRSIKPPVIGRGKELQVSGFLQSKKTILVTAFKITGPSATPVQPPQPPQPALPPPPLPPVSDITPTPTPVPTYVAPQGLSDASRFLHQSTFGPTATDIETLSQTNFESWFNQQVAEPPCFIQPQLGEGYGIPYRLSVEGVWWHCVMTSKDQLRQRMAFALSQIFVISNAGGRLSLNFRPTAAYHDMLMKNAFGNYRKLLKEISTNPVMGVMLSFVKNQKEDLAASRFPDENYARELLQLFSIGKFLLNIDGTYKIDPATGEPIPTYDQKVIFNLAKIFTGWNYWQDASRERPSWDNGTEVWTEPLIPFEQYHSPGPKTLFNGIVIPAGLSAEADMDLALDHIFNHPNVPPFISHLLIQRFVTSNPSPGYIKRVATVFINNGKGVRGDLLATLKAILTDHEARGKESFVNPKHGKLREPVVMLGNLLRITNPRISSDSDFPRIWGLFGEFGLNQNPYSAPTVFNFFHPRFSPKGVVSEAKLVAPEFETLTSINSIGRINYLTNYLLSGIAYESVLPTFSTWLALASSPLNLVEKLNLVLTANALDATTVKEIAEVVGKTPPANTKERVWRAMQLVISSPDYQIAK
jgi:uncharacterized protein (DUF1800 family)